MAASGDSRLSRGRNTAFQQYVLAYLASGDRTLVIRFERQAGLSDSAADVIEAWPIIASRGRSSTCAAISLTRCPTHGGRAARPKEQQGEFGTGQIGRLPPACPWR